jgi:hypothetical protein
MKPPCDEAVIQSGPATAPCEEAGEPLILAATILGSGMAFVDSTVVNVALPAIQRSLGGTVTNMQWIVEAYGLLLSALILTGGALGDIFGRKRLFLGCDGVRGGLGGVPRSRQSLRSVRLHETAGEGAFGVRQLAAALGAPVDRRTKGWKRACESGSKLPHSIRDF